MLWTVIGVLLLLWLVGVIGNIGGGLVHFLLVIALIVFIANTLMSRRRIS